jgi:hypothetical protein
VAVCNGIAAEDLEVTGPVERQWWSNVINEEGTIVQPSQQARQAQHAWHGSNNSRMGSIGGAAAGEAETPLTPEEQAKCRIYVFDADRELGPDIGAPPCDLGK